ncbi:PREDICTED: insulin-like growth factor-binding protein 3 receptor [Gekko japonicus]|uniref:Insulin-like growth factor-binding protein 3 receptor n=1 Tax=Gekko japonicus TaxID=146911 RepID=A0ABM1KMS3_GEKJA|nr:PREDICTED: insulin-like growth factor-binding protein 3 receptor [Gekko japonicus]
MVICSLLVSLRICLERHPPLVTFFFCLLSLAVAFGSFAAYLQSHDVPNPDVKETHEDTSTPPPSAAAEFHTTVSVLVGLTFELQNGTDPPNGTHLALTVTGRELGLKGPDTQEPIHLVIAIMNSLSHESCLSIIAPSSLLPKTRKPPECVMRERRVHPEEPGLCYQSHYQDDPALSSMLDQADRALCSQRLLLTTAFLLCLCAMLCCVAGVCYPAPRDKRGQI